MPLSIYIHFCHDELDFLWAQDISVLPWGPSAYVLYYDLHT